MLKIKFGAEVSTILLAKNDNEAKTKERIIRELGLKKVYRRIGLYRGEFLYVLDDVVYSL